MLPDTVKILFKEYSVEEEMNLHDGTDDLYGNIDYMQEKIVLCANASETQKMATLLHETLHGMDELYNIELSEEQVMKLGTALYVFMGDNKELIMEYCKE